MTAWTVMEDVVACSKVGHVWGCPCRDGGDIEYIAKGTCWVCQQREGTVGVVIEGEELTICQPCWDDIDFHPILDLDRSVFCG